MLDVRNAEISHGKLYRAGEDKPYTGRATNIPFTALMASDMRSQLESAMSEYLWPEHFGGSARQDVRHKPAMDSLVCDSRFEDGAAVGSFSCTAVNGGPILLETKDGRGDTRSITVNSRLQPERRLVFAPFKNGLLDGEFVVDRLDTVGPPLYVAPYRGGKLHGTVVGYNAVTGRLADTAEYVDGRMHGEHVRYMIEVNSPWYREHYVSGLRHGAYEMYNLDGLVIEQGEFKNGDLVRPVTAAEPESARQSPAHQSSIEECEEGWYEYARRGNEEYVIRWDEAAEIEAQCASGARAPSV